MVSLHRTNPNLVIPRTGLNPGDPTRRWIVLVLAGLTLTLAVAIPSMCLSVLFKEIADDLHLSLIEVGLIWGIAALPGILSSMLSGALGDRFGPERILRVACILSGLTGAVRGLSDSFYTLLGSVMLFGLLAPLVSVNIFKIVGTRFPRKQLGMANGVLSMGMAFGFLVGAMISATLLSPWLHGWRNVLYVYGAVAGAISLPWFFIKPVHRLIDSSSSQNTPISLKQSFVHVMQVKEVWLLGFVILCVGGCIQGTLGYLPLYLRNLGWAEASADGVLAIFHSMSMLLVFPIALSSDRLGTRRNILLASTFFFVLGISILSIANGLLIWVAVCLAGMVRDGFMAVFMTSITETEKIGVTYLGTASGFVMIFSGFGSMIAPPIGNSLAAIAPGLPFLFWSALAAIGFVIILFIKEKASGRIIHVQ